MRRNLLTLIPPLLLFALAELLHRLLFASHTVNHVLGSGDPSLGSLGALLGFYLLRLAALFVGPGWLLVITIRLGIEVRRSRA